MFGIDLEYIGLAIISAAIIVVLGLLYGLIKDIYKFFENQNIQGPKPIPFIGTWRGSVKKFLGDEDISLTKQYGKIVGTFDGLTPNVAITQPDIIKQILSLSTDNFHDRRVFTTKNPILKKSLLSLCGEEDKEVQKFIASLLTEEKIQKLLPRLDTSASTLSHNISKKIEEDNNIKLTTLIEEFIEDLIALAVFGVDLNSDGEFREEFIKYLRQIFSIKNPNSYLALIPFLYPSIQGDSWIVPQNALKYFTDLISSGIKETPRNTVVTEGKAAHLIDLLVEASEEEKKLVKKDKEGESEDRILTDEVIICKCLSSILTLVNSARTTILFTIYELAKNPEIQEKLSNEIQSNKSDKISCTDLKNCRYLDMILSEVLRLYPFEFRLEKICKESTDLGPVHVEKGNRVSVPLFPLHHNDEYYPEAEKFDPERFTPEATEKRNPYTYLPFGQAGLNGSNSSLQLSVLVSKLTVYKLVEKLQFSKSGDEDQVLFKTGITGIPVPENLTVKAELRSK